MFVYLAFNSPQTVDSQLIYSTGCISICIPFWLQTRGYVTDEILHSEPEEGLEKLQDAMRVCLSFQTSYHSRRTNLAMYFKQQPVVEWNFHPLLVFGRLEQFMDRLTTVEDYFKTVVEFVKLEKIEFGGVKGRSLSEMVVNIFTQFTSLMNKFNNSTYDPLDIASKVQCSIHNHVTCIVVCCAVTRCVMPSLSLSVCVCVCVCV